MFVCVFFSPFHCFIGCTHETGGDGAVTVAAVTTVQRTRWFSIFCLCNFHVCFACLFKSNFNLCAHIKRTHSRTHTQWSKSRQKFYNENDICKKARVHGTHTIRFEYRVRCHNEAREQEINLVVLRDRRTWWRRGGHKKIGFAYTFWTHFRVTAYELWVSLWAYWEANAFFPFRFALDVWWHSKIVFHCVTCSYLHKCWRCVVWRPELVK